jgi:ACS family hexuronate transporter-like MFS transporter
VAPPLIASIIGLGGWRWVFFVTGAVGLLWTLWWLRDYHTPAPVSEHSEPQGARISWIRLFSFRETWGLVLAKFLSDAAWYFYLFWLPKYLYDVRDFDTKEVGYFAWIPYAAAGVGALVGGWFSSYLLARGQSLNAARKVALGASAALMPLIIFVTRSPIELTIVLFSIAFFGQQ